MPKWVYVLVLVLLISGNMVKDVWHIVLMAIMAIMPLGSVCSLQLVLLIIMRKTTQKLAWFNAMVLLLIQA